MQAGLGDAGTPPDIWAALQMLVGMMWNDRIVALQMLVGKGCRKGFDLYMGESHGAGDMIRLICEKVGKPTQEVAWHVTSRASEDHRKGTNRTVI